MIEFAIVACLVVITSIFIALNYFEEEKAFKILKLILIIISIASLIPMINYWLTQAWCPSPTIENTTYYPSLQEKYKDWKKKEETTKRYSSFLNSKKKSSTFRMSSDSKLKELKQEQQEAWREFENEQEKYKPKYDKTFFSISSTVGTISIIIGVFLGTIMLAPGYIVGGIVCLSLGYYQYWDRIAAGMRFTSLLILLLLAIFLGFKFSRKDS